VFVGASVVAIFVCTLAVQANTARVLFAMARDRAVPGWSWLGRVHPQERSPQAAALVAGILGAALLLVNLNFEKVMTALVCVSIVWANLAYLLTTAPLLVRRLRDGPAAGSYLGRWGLPVNAVAVAWSVALLVNISWPRARLYGDEWYQLYGAPLYTAGLLAAGVVAYRVLWPGRGEVAR
jgi:amino acid transporter